jgi:hypothetical protein
MFEIFDRVEVDRYQAFLVLVVSVLALMTAGMLAVAIWLFRRNRRLPRLVKGRRQTRRAHDT